MTLRPSTPGTGRVDSCYLFGSAPVGVLWWVSFLHGAAPSTPVPHWVVLLAVVPALWLLVGAAVVAVDRLLRRFGG